MPAYYLGFDVVKINDKSMHIRQAGAEVDVWNVTDDETLGTVEADENGVVGSGDFDLPAGTVVEFSVDGYDATIQRTLASSAVAAAFTSDVSLILENLYEQTTTDPAYNDVYIKDSAASEPRKVGMIEPGGTLSVPYNPAENSEIEVFAIARTERGASDAFDLASAVKLSVNPNRETALPNIYQIGAVANTQAVIGISGYSPNAQHRKVEVAFDSGFSDGLQTLITSAATQPGQILPDVQTLTRTLDATYDSDLSLTKTKYVRVSHSSNGESFGAPSDTLTLVYPATGGGAGYEPPTLDGYFDGSSTVFLSWTSDIGGSGDWTLERKLSLGGSYVVIDNAVPSADRSASDIQTPAPTAKTIFYRLKRTGGSVYSNEVNIYIPREF